MNLHPVVCRIVKIHAKVWWGWFGQHRNFFFDGWNVTRINGDSPENKSEYFFDIRIGEGIWKC